MLCECFVVCLIVSFCFKIVYVGYVEGGVCYCVYVCPICLSFCYFVVSFFAVGSWFAVALCGLCLFIIVNSVGCISVMYSGVVSLSGLVIIVFSCAVIVLCVCLLIVALFCLFGGLLNVCLLLLIVYDLW